MQTWDTTFTEPVVEPKSEIQKWLRELKRVLPEDSAVKVMLREEAPNVFHVRFLTSHLGKRLVSQAQGTRLDLAISSAGSSLFRKVVGARKKKFASLRKVRREQKYFTQAA